MSNELAVKVPPLSSLEVLTATWHASCTGEFMRLLMRIIVLVVCLTVLLTVLFVNLQQRKSNDLFVVIVNGKRGFINRSGEMIIQPKWIGANSFSEDRAVVAVDSWSLTQGMDRLITTYGYIDITGKLVIPAVYDYAGDFKDGLALVGVGEFGIDGIDDHKYGFIDLNGNWVITHAYHRLYGFFDGLAAAENDNGKWGFLNKTGKVEIPFQFEFGSMFSESLAPMFSEEKYGFIDKSGKWAIKPQFTQANGFVDGLAVVKRGGVLMKPEGSTLIMGNEDSSAQFEIIDRKGKTVTKFGKGVSSVRNFSEGLAAVEVKKDSGPPLTGFIDTSGQFVIEPKFPFVGDFSDGLAKFLLNGKWAFMDSAGNVIFSTDYQVSYGFKRGLASITKVEVGGSLEDQNHTLGYIDKTGKVIWEPTN